jgi:hypothetical protein
MEEIFGNAYDTPSNIASQLKNPYVSPKTKLRIYDNTSSYYKILNAILTDINSKMRDLNIEYVSNDNDKENGAIIEECNEFIKSFNQMLEKYGKKTDEWKRLEQSALKAEGAAATEGAAIMVDESKQKQELNMTNFTAQQKEEQEYESDDELPPYVEGAATGRSSPSNVFGRISPTIMRSDAKVLYGKDARGEIVDAKRSGYMSPGLGAGGGRKRQQVRKTRKLKRRPRKTTKRGGRGKRSMKRKYRSRRNTRRR